MNRKLTLSCKIAWVCLIGVIIVTHLNLFSNVRGFSTDFQTISIPTPTVSTESLTYYSTQNLPCIIDSSNDSYGRIFAVNTHTSGQIAIFDKLKLESTVSLPAGRLDNGNLIIRFYDYYSLYGETARYSKFGNNYSSIISWAPALSDWPFNYHYRAQFTVNVINAQTNAMIKSVCLYTDFNAQSSNYLSTFTLNDTTVSKQIVTKNLSSIKYQYAALGIPLSLSSSVSAVKIQLIATNDGKSFQQYFGDALARPGSAYMELCLAEVILRLNSAPTVKITSDRTQTMVIGQSKYFPFNTYVDQFTTWYTGGTAQIKVDSTVKSTPTFNTVKNSANINYLLSADDSKSMLPGEHQVRCSIINPTCTATDYYTLIIQNDIPTIIVDSIPTIELGENIEIGYQISDIFHEMDRSVEFSFNGTLLHQNNWNPNSYVEFLVNSTILGVGTHNISILLTDGYTGQYTPGIFEKNISVTIVDTTKPMVTLLFNPSQPFSEAPAVEINILDFALVTARFILHDKSPATVFNFEWLESSTYCLNSLFSDYWDILANGYLAFDIEVSDTSLNTQVVSDWCKKDTISPTIYNISFKNGDFWNESKDVIVYVDDLNPILSCNLTIGSKMYPMYEGETHYYVLTAEEFKEEFSILEDGVITFSCTCEDFACNQHALMFTIIKDSTPPEFSLNLNDYYSNHIDLGNIVSSEPVSYEFSIDGSNFALMDESISINSLLDGVHNLQVRASDRASNFMVKQFLFTKDSILPSILSLYYPIEVFDGSYFINFTTNEPTTIQVMVNSYIIATSGLSTSHTLEIDPMELDYGLNSINITIFDGAGNSFSRTIEIERVEFANIDLSTLLFSSPLQALLSLGLVGLAAGITYIKTRPKEGHL
jgi:hypothetical protein